MAIPGIVLLILLVVATAAVAVDVLAQRRVSRARVQRFARRQRLEITPDNGNQVIAYLAVTRRWRVAGLLVALVLAVTSLAFAGEATVHLLQLLAGWFIGAVIAEVRLARQPAGQRRSASLEPRDSAAYLSPFARVTYLAAFAISVGLGALTLIVATRGGSGGRESVLALAAAIVVGGLVSLLRRYILTRPQAVLAPDQLAADDAIRSRSLHVLAGAGTALVLYAAGFQLTALQRALSGAAADSVGGGVLLVVVVAPVLGWIVATTPWSVNRVVA